MNLRYFVVVASIATVMLVTSPAFPSTRDND
jgi:hypothetical protein